MASERFRFAVWKLREDNDAAPLTLELERLEKTAVGQQIAEARRLLAAVEPES